MSGALSMLAASAAGGSGGRTILYSGTLTSGLYSSTPIVAYGYFASGVGGTLSPTTYNTSPVLTITYVTDQIVSSSLYTSYITINGFNADPGNTYLYSLEWNGTEHIYTGGATDYNWSGTGTKNAQWTFYKTASPNFGFQAGNGLARTLILRG